MQHLGDITQIHGDAVPAVDCIIGGSPCQDLSVAGKRAGLAGERSGLFMEQIRITKEILTETPDGQSRLFAPDTWSGRTSPEHSVLTKEKTLRPSSRKSCGSQSRTRRVCLCLVPAGQNGEVSATWEEDGALLGELSTRNTGESPSAAVESRLSQILEETPQPKYFLSAQACAGILRRAERRGKELPEMLRIALEQTIAREQSQSTP